MAESSHQLPPVEIEVIIPQLVEPEQASTRPTPDSLFSSKDAPRKTHGKLPFLSELLVSRRRRKQAPTQDRSTEAVPSPLDEIDRPLNPEPLVITGIKVGNLSKSSQSRRENAAPGPSRLRRFRLTEEALEYFQQFSQVKVRRSFPLTSIEDVEYPLPPPAEPTHFRLLFTTYVMTLVAENEDEAKDWVKEIKKAWKMWQLPPGTPGTEFGGTLSGPEQLTPSDGHAHSPVSMGDEQEEEEQQPSSLSQPVSKKDVQDKILSPVDRPRAHTIGELTHRESSMDMGTYDRRKKAGRQAFRIRNAVRLTPRLVKSTNQMVHTADQNSFDHLHDDYAMIKYPHRWWTIPAEKLFKVDKDNLQILWRRTASSQFSYSNSLSFHRIVEIREGQQTDQFDRFPYEEVDGQSFSLMFEDESGGKYVRLLSLDLICDHPNHYQEWIEGLRTLIPPIPQCTIFPYSQEKHRNVDPTILWLKRLWATKSSDHEITQKEAISIVKKMKPSITPEDAKLIAKNAHNHQFRHTFNYGAALRWDGFVLLFNLLCERQESRLFSIFKQYAKTYPNLGMTLDEFKQFLVEECYWEQRQCLRDDIQNLVNHHDYHHRSFKKLVAENKPFEYQLATSLLSFAGFLSFLRSKDNSPINLEHETVYQDPTQPLSHYFINSSHNTYLEADQLKGRSSNDAYVRALLQGARCIEIDCWDDTFNVTGLSGEPIIYHGYTLTTKLPFRAVIQTIKEYAFRTSYYPVIISIENHCSAAQQSNMAKIFHAVMGNVLVLENLVEQEGRERLPSPQELQGKIILKGSFKQEIKGTAPRPTRAPRKAPAPNTTSPGGGLKKTQRTTSETSFASQGSQEENSLTNLGRSESDNHPLSPEEVSGPAGTEVVFSITFSQQPYNRRSLKEFTRSLERSGQDSFLPGDDQELIFTETADDLKTLIVYCRAVSIKPWSWKRQRQTTVSEMFSFGELTAIRHCKDSPREMLACSERQLVRTYPKGGRIDSSNYNPTPMWNCGIQMAALNFQYPDVWMHLNQGLFRLNGGCGYVLKPEVMRKPDAGGSTPYDPYMFEPNPEVPTVDIEIELLSGQRLCFLKKKCTQIYVEIQTYGITEDCVGMKPAVSSESLWPQWPEGVHKLEKRILMPELCLVYFRVEVQLRKRQLYGQNCIPLISLMPGIKFIPLRTSGGELIPDSGLFVRIKKMEESIGRQSSYLKRQERVSMNEAGEDSDGMWAKDIDVTQSIPPSRGGKKRQDSALGSRPLSSPPILGSFEEEDEKSNGVAVGGVGTGFSYPHQQVDDKQLQVVAEVHSEADDVSANRAVPKEDRQEKTVVFSVKPMAGIGEEDEALPTVTLDPEKEFHLTVMKDEVDTGEATFM